MADLTTHYLGLNLKNPVIVGSSGMTGTIEGIVQVAENGAGAVVLKSIFEEQILHEMESYLRESEMDNGDSFHKGYQIVLNEREYDYKEAYSYLADHVKDLTLRKYLTLISEAKKAISIPVIASINCTTAYNWHYFARKIEEAGADALELNVYVLPSNTMKNSAENEKVYFEIIDAVLKQIKIPVSVKVGYYFSSLATTAIDLSQTGISGLVLFNRPFHPDININKLEIHSKYLLSEPSEYSHVLRWIALLSGRVECPLVATTGIHTAETAIKQILAGATAIEVVSAIYKHGYPVISEIISGISTWMDEKGYKTLESFRGKMNQQGLANPAEFERVQFMKFYSEIV